GASAENLLWTPAARVGIDVRLCPGGQMRPISHVRRVTLEGEVDDVSTGEATPPHDTGTEPSEGDGRGAAWDRYSAGVDRQMAAIVLRQAAALRAAAAKDRERAALLRHQAGLDLDAAGIDD